MGVVGYATINCCAVIIMGQYLFSKNVILNFYALKITTGDNSEHMTCQGTHPNWSQLSPATAAEV